MDGIIGLLVVNICMLCLFFPERYPPSLSGYEHHQKKLKRNRAEGLIMIQVSVSVGLGGLLGMCVCACMARVCRDSQKHIEHGCMSFVCVYELAVFLAL